MAQRRNVELMLHPDLVTMLARDRLGDLHAEAARTRLIRRLTSLRQRQPTVDTFSPSLTLVATPPRDVDIAATDPRVA